MEVYLPENREAELVKTLSQTLAFQGLEGTATCPGTPKVEAYLSAKTWPWSQ